MNAELLPAIAYDAAMTRNAEHAWRDYVDRTDRLTVVWPSKEERRSLL